jgi:hypothetical protein
VVNRKTLETTQLAFSSPNLKPVPCCDSPKPYSDLRSHTDEDDGSTGLIVQMDCENCGTVYGFMHPYSWADMVENKPSNEFTDVLKHV